jgi:membrane protease YdiL (CAAX protease family)
MDAGDAPAAPTRTLPFFVAAFGFTWALQLPALLAKYGILAGPPERFMPLVGLGAFGPLLAAVLASRLERGGPGAGALLDRLRLWRLPVRWYLVALGLFTAIYVAGVAIATLVPGRGPLPWLYPPENGPQVAALFVFPLGEEPGWRGFALPRLQQRHGQLKASLLLGVGWALWHTFMFLLAGTTPSLFLVSVANIVAASVVFSWLFNHTRGSLPLAILAHVGVHLCNPAHALPGTPTPFVVFTLALAVVACGLVLGDRGVWRNA